MIDIILTALALLSAAYFIVIVLYSGIGTSFVFIWLFFSALCLFLVYGKWYYARNKERIPRWVPVSVVTTCIAGMAVFGVVCVLVFTGVAGPDPRGLDYVIVLGPRVTEKADSSSMKRRLDKAMEYVESNPDTILVLSGGKGKGGTVSEAMEMFLYLTYNGVPPEQLLLEEYSASTVENIAYSKIIIDRDRRIKKLREGPPELPAGPGAPALAPDKPVEVGILTSNYHVYRAELTAAKWGLENVSGIAADSDPVLFVHMCVRECASILKDRLMGNM